MEQSRQRGAVQCASGSGAVQNTVVSSSDNNKFGGGVMVGLGDTNYQNTRVDQQVEEEEMSVTERELADDAAWKRIQQNTFTRWANEHLKTVGKQITNLETDFSDGLRLISLIEVLSGKRMPRHNRKPSFRSQKLENVSVALQFLERDENIRIVNIDSTDIVDCKLKLILGLIWTLILHYSISIPMWEGETSPTSEKQATPKQRLLHWIQGHVGTPLPINNFTNDWNDGRAVGALVDSVAPGLCADWPDWTPNEAIKNTTTAMTLADDWLGVPQLITPEEMINPNCDELSMMTYLSQFPNAKMKTGAPLKPRNQNQQVKVFGPGLESEGVVAGVMTHFTVDVHKAGKGKVEAILVDSTGAHKQLELVTSSQHPQVYTVRYTAKAEGRHQVIVRFSGRDTPASPYTVGVAAPLGDPSMVTATGPGLLPDGVVISKTTYFDIFANGAGRGDFEVIILDANGSKTTSKVSMRSRDLHEDGGDGGDVTVQQDGGGASNGVARRGSKLSSGGGGGGSANGFSSTTAGGGVGHEVTRVEYTPTTLGLHSVNVFFAGKPIPGSPFGVKIAPASNARRVKASGRGLQPTGVRVGDVADFKVVTKSAGEGDLVVKVIGPGGVSVPVEEEELDNYSSRFVYRPILEGKHVIMVNYGGAEVPRSPFQVGVGPTKSSRIKAFGPGLHGGVAGQPATFTVEANGETGALGFSIEGPSEAKIECKDLGDGSADVTYLPTCDGEYALHVLCQGEDIPDSPYIADILPAHSGLTIGDLTKVICSGPGVSKSGVIVDQETTFTVKGVTNPDDIAVQVINSSYETLPVRRSGGSGVGSTKQYKFSYTPQTASKHTVMVTYGGLSLQDSPYRVVVTEACDPLAVVVKGPGIESGVKSNTPTHFDIDCKKAGPGDVQIALSNETGQDVPISIRDNGDGTFRVDYETRHVGRHKVVVLYAGVEVPQSPVLVPVQPSVDVSKVKVEGLEPSVFVECPTSFVVDTRQVGVAPSRNSAPIKFGSTHDRDGTGDPSDVRDQGKLLCLITSPSGGTTDSLVEAEPDHTYKISYTPFEEGCHTIDLIYSGAPIPGSPFTVNVKRGSDASKCRAWGPGLTKGKIGLPNNFTVETKGAGSGGLGLAIEGPSEAELICRDNRDGSCTVEYTTETPGDYDIAVRFADIHIPGSPFKVLVEGGEASKVVCYGPGLEPGKVRAGQPLHFTVDASKTEIPGPGHKSLLKITITSDKGPLCNPPVVREVKGGVYDVSYTPEQGGADQLTEVIWAGEHVPGSPWTQRVSPKYSTSSPAYEHFYPSQQKQPRGGVDVSGPGVDSPGVPASLPTSLTIDASDAPDMGKGDLDVNVMGPDGHPRKTDLEKTGPGTYKASFLPDDCGKYRVTVRYNGDDIPSSPYPVQAYATGKADKCQITEGISHSLNIGEEYCISVNAKNAGHGAVTCRIRSNSGSDLDIDITDNGDGTFSIYYTVEDAGDYSLAVKFGGQPVPQGFYTFTAQDNNTTSSNNIGLEQQQQQSSRTTSSSTTTTTTTTRYSDSVRYPTLDLTQIPLPSTGGHVTATVIMPSGDQVSPVITDNRDGTVRVVYNPTQEGVHELIVCYNGENVQGSPFKFYIDSLESGTVTAHGSGLVHGITGEPSTFTISSKNAGAGSLSLAVEGPSKAEISCHDNKDGTVTASYLPTSPGDYKVSIKFADKHIRGSPYTAKVTGEGRKRNQISVGSQSEVKFPFTVNETEVSSLNAAIMAPSGLEEPCFIKKLTDGNVGISFTPREKGQHWVSIRKKGSDIKGSPFKIEVSASEVGDAARVLISGPGLKVGKTQQENTFTVDTRNAGFGGLSLSIEGPSKAEITCKDNENGTLAISYRPTEPGYYIINLKFADNLVDESPYTVKVTGEGSNRQTERIHRQRDAAPLTEVGSQCRLTFKLPGISPYDLSSLVTSPKGVSEAAETVDLDEGLFGVNFVPKELGVHTVSVKYMDAHIPGSPFQFTVGPLKDGGAHRVHAGGPGLERGEVVEPCEFNVWTREAGAGALAISVEGPSKAVIDFKDRKDGSCYASYCVNEPGEYRVGIKFNDKHIPDSPFKVFVTPSAVDARKVEVAQFPDQGAKVNKAQNCMIIRNGAKGDIDAKLVTPSGKEDDVFMDRLDDEVHAVRFVPRVNGVHYFHVKCKGIQIPGSPFRLRIGEEEADPAACCASGKGLSEIQTGTKADFIVDTCAAGAGTLAVTIDGPSKVSMDCTEVDNGYKVRYTPLVNGDYYVHVKYNNVHISGSPWKVKCTGMGKTDKILGVSETSQVVVETVEKVATKTDEESGPTMPHFTSDATKVLSKGLGLKRAHPGRLNNFTINASEAGGNILYVGVYGPKGPCEEVSIKHIGHYNYQVSYLIKDRGEHLLIIKWGEEHVPGSPFKIVT